MTNEEAKFVLTAYRPGGRDSDDPVLAGAIRQAQSDPNLQTWWARSQAFDGAMAARLREVAPPPGLREAILTGAKLSRPKQRRRQVLGWLALAAAVAVLLSVAGTGYYHAHTRGAELSGLAQFALNDVRQGGHLGDPDQPLDRWLTTSQEPLDHGALPVNWAQMQSTGCRSLSFAGTKVFEVCFSRGGVMYHLYVLPRSESGRLPSAEQVELTERDGAAAAWSDSHFVYALATRAGTAMLRRVL